MILYATNAERPIGDLPSLDATRLESLRNLCAESDPALFDDLLSSWAQESAKRLQEIHGAWTSGDPRALRAAAHALHGICSSTGVIRLSEYSQALESEATSWAAVAPILSAMDDELREVRNLLCPDRAA